MRYLLGVLAIATGCATAEDPGSGTFDGAASDTTIIDETAPPADSAKVEDSSDSSVTESSAPDTTVTETGVTETSVMETSVIDTAVDSAADSATTETEADTGVVDTGADSGTCGPTDKYGPKCKTNLDCAAIPSCGYVCCAFDPFLMTNLGCGRTSFGTSCLP